MLEVQRLAALTIGRVLAGRSLSEALAVGFRLAPPQRAALQDLAYGTLRHYGRLDALAGLLLTKPLRDRKLHDLLLVGLYQLQFTRAAPHAIVDQAVRATAALGVAAGKGLVNAVLRNFLRRQEALWSEAAEVSEVARYSYPQWWIDRVKDDHPDGWSRILEAGNTHPPMTLRVNLRRTGLADYQARLAEQRIEAVHLGDAALRLARPLPVDRLPGFADGLVSVQDWGAQRAASFLDAAPGARVLDACSAPGGKTAHLLETGDLDLTALDADPERLSKVADNLNRLGLKADVKAGDAGDLSAWWDGRLFQRILADVPCSASGVVRRHPDSKWLRRAADIPQFAAEQARLLDALWQCLESGGKLLYATCSLFHAENGAQIEAFLQRHADARPAVLPQTDTNQYQLLPDDDHDGFYYALLEKL